MGTERALYNANDGLTGRDGGPYLDQEEDRLAEERRARVEGRKPDLENPPSSAGTVLVTAGQLLANQGVNNIPSKDGSLSLGEEAAVKSLADDKDNGLKARGFLPEDAVASEEDISADLSMRSALMTDGSAAAGEKNTEPIKPAAKKTAAKKTASSAKQKPASSTDKSSDPAGTRSTAK